LWSALLARHHALELSEPVLHHDDLVEWFRLRLIKHQEAAAIACGVKSRSSLLNVPEISGAVGETTENNVWGSPSRRASPASTRTIHR
jgi:hypothetical protein